MLQTFRNAWRIEELRKKILFTLLIVLLYRLGNAVPVPFVDTKALADYFQASGLQNTILGLFNVMSGGAFSQATIFALAGTGLGALLALPLAFLSTPKLLPRPVALLFRVLIVAIRSVPFLIYGLIFIRVSGPGAFTGVLTLAVCSIGLLSKRFTEAIESLDFRAYDALRAMGVSLLPRIRYAVLPQLGPAFSSAVLYRFDVNIREASVLGLVGAGGIGAPLIFAMNQYAWNDVSAIFLGFVLLVWLIDAGSARLRTRRAAAAPGNKT